MSHNNSFIKPKAAVKKLPDRVFHKLWNNAAEYEIEELYIRAYTSPLSEQYINFHKFKISADTATDILRLMYKAQHMSFREILIKYGLKKAEFSHKFCIPIRTVEDWVSQTREPPSYVKLMVLRELGYFGDSGTFAAVATDTKKSPVRKNRTTALSAFTEDDETFYKSLDNIGLSTINQKTPVSASAANNIHEILAKTDYLKPKIQRTTSSNKP